MGFQMSDQVIFQCITFTTSIIRTRESFAVIIIIIIHVSTLVLVCNYMSGMMRSLSFIGRYNNGMRERYEFPRGRLILITATST